MTRSSQIEGRLGRRTVVPVHAALPTARCVFNRRILRSSELAAAPRAAVRRFGCTAATIATMHCFAIGYVSKNALTTDWALDGHFLFRLPIDMNLFPPTLADPDWSDSACMKRLVSRSLERK